LREKDTSISSEIGKV